MFFHSKGMLPPRRWLVLQKRASLQVSEDLPQQVHNGPLPETGNPFQGKVQRSLLMFPPCDVLPLPKDVPSPVTVLNSKPLFPHHVGLLLLKGALSKEKMHQSLLMFLLYASPLQQSDALIPGRVFLEQMRKHLVNQEHPWLIRRVIHPQRYVVVLFLIIAVTFFVARFHNNN